jgi:hypothetical protein
MPHAHTVLGETSGNRVRGKDLTPYERGLVIGAYRFGIKEAAIIREFKLSRGAVRSTIQNIISQPQGESQLRTGRPTEYNNRDERKMLRNLRLYPTLTFMERRKATGLNMSNSTIKRLVIKSGLKQ